MNSLAIKNFMTNNIILKNTILKIILPKNQARPRFWIKILLNPFMIKRGKRSLICKNTRMDILPFNQFSIGNDSTIEDFSTINNGVGDVLIGDRTRIGLGNVIIGPAEIGNDVMLAQNIVLSALNHGYEDPDKPISMQPITKSKIKIEDEVWIGANSTINSGVTVGRHSVIGSGSVVTKNIPPYTVAVGNPAKVIKKYNPDKMIWERI